MGLEPAVFVAMCLTLTWDLVGGEGPRLAVVRSQRGWSPQ